MKLKSFNVMAILIAFTTFFASCSKYPVVPPVDEITSITLTSDKATLKNDGTDKASFTVKDNKDNDVTASCEFYNGTTKLTAANFTSTTEGSYEITAKYKTFTSNKVSITVSKDVTVTSIVLTADKLTINNGGTDKASFTVKDNNGNDITTTCEFYNGVTKLADASFASTTEGNFDITAKFNTLTSNVITIAVTKSIALTFTRKVFAEDFTGTWCGWCPLMAFNLDSMIEKNANIISVGIHDGDVLQSGYQKDIEKLVPGFAGFPTGFVNRKQKASQFSIIKGVNDALAVTADAGMKIETTVSGTSTVTAKVTTGFAKDFSAATINLAIMLVEDGIVLNQHTYYYHYKGLNTAGILYNTKDNLPTWVHNGVLRKYATGLKGDAIPAASTTAGNATYEKSVSLPLTGYTAANCRVIAVLIDNATGQVLNAQAVKVGETQAFD